MKDVMVKAKIPDDFELACDEMRPPKEGELFVSSSDGSVVTGCDNSFVHNRIIVRPAWQWPSWLIAAAIVSYGRVWYCCEHVPILTKDGWVDGGLMRVIDEQLFDFTPPPCDDWKQSLRLNPNTKAKP